MLTHERTRKKDKQGHYPKACTLVKIPSDFLCTRWKIVITKKGSSQWKKTKPFSFSFNNQHAFQLHIYSHVLQKASGFLLLCLSTYQFHTVASTLFQCWGVPFPHWSRSVSRRAIFYLAHRSMLRIIDMTAFNNSSC